MLCSNVATWHRGVQVDNLGSGKPVTADCDDPHCDDSEHSDGDDSGHPPVLPVDNVLPQLFQRYRVDLLYHGMQDAPSACVDHLVVTLL